MESAKMKVMIFAAGLGTRLRPLTDTTPKALIPVGGHPLLEILLEKLKTLGADDVTVNVHHLASQIVNFLNHYPHEGMKITVSDESAALLDTGGGLRKAFSGGTDRPVLIHNVDILSNADLKSLYNACHDCDAVLLASKRETQRYLLFNENMEMVGWTNIKTGQVRSPYTGIDPDRCTRLAFAGIHVVAPSVLKAMRPWPDKFPIMDFYIRMCRQMKIKGFVQDGLRLLDVGKQDTLKTAEVFYNELTQPDH